MHMHTSTLSCRLISQRTAAARARPFPGHVHAPGCYTCIAHTAILMSVTYLNGWRMAALSFRLQFAWRALLLAAS